MAIINMLEVLKDNTFKELNVKNMVLLSEQIGNLNSDMETTGNGNFRDEKYNNWKMF